MIGPFPTASHRRRLIGVLLGSLALLACSRPIDRPLEGARPASSDGRGVAAPPTLAPPASTATPPPPSPIVQPVPSASPSLLAGRNPILSGLSPPPSAVVPPGAVSIGARISGSSDLAATTLSLNGATVQPQITAQDPRVWLVAYTSQLGEGRHEVRLNARDQDGRSGGYTWQFDVRPRTQPAPAPRR